MDTLKLALIQVPTLVKIDYLEGAGEVILAADASLKG
jgi:hypothetical protein